jgi:hypothetical protein
MKTRFKTHGNSRLNEYAIWHLIKVRCYNKNNKAYYRYGGRGIVMCDEWRDSFMAFYEDMGNRPSKDHSIDRIENDKGYYKENCRWATRKEQQNNRRNSIRVVHKGVIRSLREISDITGINYNTVCKRYQKGHDLTNLELSQIKII